MLKLLLSVVLVGLVWIGCLAQSAHELTPVVTYRNPVIAGDFADPSVIRVGDTYYAAGTSSEWAPAYPIYTSKDLINWDYVGPVFKTMPNWTMGSYWAPELFYRNGLFYVYYTARRRSDKHSYIGVATTRDLRQGFTDHGVLVEWTTEAIDAFVVEDGGKLFITWKAYGLDKGKAIELLGAELAPDGLRVTGEAFTLLTAERSTWEAGGAEGQAIFKRGRYFYMTYSGNACCGPRCNYQVGLARSETLQGPWEKFTQNPVLVGDEIWKCPGHGTVVTTPDNRYFYLHHAYDGTDFTFTGRQGVLSELVWNEKTQWPAFRYGTATPAQAQSPLGTQQKIDRDLTVDFSKNADDVPWVWDVGLPKPLVSVQGGYLQVANTTANPTGSFLGLVAKKGTYTMEVEIRPQTNVLQSLCLYGDASNALGLGVRNGSLELWQVKDGTRQVLKSQPLPEMATAITLSMNSRYGKLYQFFWSQNGTEPIQITETPVDGSFLPRWDRAPRVGISAAEGSQTPGLFKSIRIHYE